MIRIPFTPEEIKALDYERYHHPHRRVQKKMEALWLKSQGLSHGEIARLTSISPNTLRAYLRQYLEGGIEALKIVNFRQQQSELMNHHQTLFDYFLQHPAATIKEAQANIKELTGIKRSENRIRLFLKSIGIKRYKVGTIPAKADIEEQDRFKKGCSHVWRMPQLVKEPSFLSMPLISRWHHFLVFFGRLHEFSSKPLPDESASMF